MPIRNACVTPLVDRIAGNRDAGVYTRSLNGSYAARIFDDLRDRDFRFHARSCTRF